MGVVREHTVWTRAYLGAVGVARCGVAAAAVLGRLVTALIRHLRKTLLSPTRRRQYLVRTVVSADVNSS